MCEWASLVELCLRRLKELRNASFKIHSACFWLESVMWRLTLGAF
jgi:hypothetical protein